MTLEERAKYIVERMRPEADEWESVRDVLAAVVKEEREAIIQIGQALLIGLNVESGGPATDAELMRQLEAAIRARSEGTG